MAQTAYRIPDTPNASVKPGQTGFGTVPINRMNPRSFVTNLQTGATVKPGTELRGLALGGDCGVRTVELSTDDTNWHPAALGNDDGPYGFRPWRWTLPAAAAPGPLRLLVRCTNAKGAVQPMDPVWNPGGYMQNVVETLNLAVAA